MLSQLTILGMTGYILLTLTALGYIMDQRYSTRPSSCIDFYGGFRIFNQTVAKCGGGVY